jgi:hypothetical protein
MYNAAVTKAPFQLNWKGGQRPSTGLHNRNCNVHLRLDNLTITCNLSFQSSASFLSGLRRQAGDGKATRPQHNGKLGVKHNTRSALSRTCILFALVSHLCNAVFQGTATKLFALAGTGCTQLVGRRSWAAHRRHARTSYRGTQVRTYKTKNDQKRTKNWRGAKFVWIQSWKRGGRARSKGMATTRIEGFRVCKEYIRSSAGAAGRHGAMVAGWGAGGKTARREAGEASQRAQPN